MPLETCPRCNQSFEDYEDWRDHESCLYLACDLVTCRARKDVVYHDIEDAIEMWREIAEHWQLHRYLCGCSHGN